MRKARMKKKSSPFFYSGIECKREMKNHCRKNVSWGILNGELSPAECVLRTCMVVVVWNPGKYLAHVIWQRRLSPGINHGIKRNAGIRRKNVEMWGKFTRLCARSIWACNFFASFFHGAPAVQSGKVRLSFHRQKYHLQNMPAGFSLSLSLIIPGFFFAARDQSVCHVTQVNECA